MIGSPYSATGFGKPRVTHVHAVSHHHAGAKIKCKKELWVESGPIEDFRLQIDVFGFLTWVAKELGEGRRKLVYQHRRRAARSQGPVVSHGGWEGGENR